MSDRYGLTALLAVRAHECAVRRRALAAAEVSLARQRRLCQRLEAQLRACQRATRSESVDADDSAWVSAAELVTIERYRVRAHRERVRMQARLDRECERLGELARAAELARERLAVSARAHAASVRHRADWLADVRALSAHRADEDREDWLAARSVGDTRG